MKNLLSTIVFIALSNYVYSQTLRYEGTSAPDSAVLLLLKKYSEVFSIRDVAERDANRKDLVSPAYFYHGMDGAPISLAGLTKRQTNNNFKVLQDSVYDEVLYQYENTAILIFKEWQHLTDKGVDKQSLNSVLILMGKENGRWIVIADIIGMQPKSSVVSTKK